jgi:hypothetical protein
MELFAVSFQFYGADMPALLFFLAAFICTYVFSVFFFKKKTRIADTRFLTILILSHIIKYMFDSENNRERKRIHHSGYCRIRENLGAFAQSPIL